MPITQCQHQKQIVLVCFHQVSLSLLLQVEQANVEGYLRDTYPIASNIVYLPNSFYSIAHFLRHKANGSTYYQNVIKRALINFCTNFKDGFDALGTSWPLFFILEIRDSIFADIWCICSTSSSNVSPMPWKCLISFTAWLKRPCIFGVKLSFAWVHR